MKDINILCVTASKDTLTINTSTMVLNKTIIEGIKELGHKIDLVTLDYYNDPDIVYNNELASFIDKIHLVDTKRIGKKHIQGSGNYFKNLKFKIQSFIYNTLIDVIIPNYKVSDLRDILQNKHYDLILTLCPPADSTFLTKHLIKYNKNLKEVRWIQYWSDPMTASLLDFDIKIPKKRYINKMLEGESLNKADEIVYCTPLLCEVQKKIHPRYAERMRWVDVGYIREYYSEKGISSKGTGDIIIDIGYFGAYQKDIRDILPLFRSMKSIKDARLNVYGDTDLEDLEYENVNVTLGRIPYKEIKKSENESDILVCICNKKGVQIPGKIFYYASYNKPVIVILDGMHQKEIGEYLSEFDRYIICENREDAIENAIKEAINSLPDYNVKLPEKLKPDYVAKTIIG